MEIDLIFKIAGIGILVGIIHTLLARFGKDEYAYVATVVGLVIVFGMVVNLVSKLFDNLKLLFKLY